MAAKLLTITVLTLLGACHDNDAMPVIIPGEDAGPARPACKIEVITYGMASEGAPSDASVKPEKAGIVHVTNAEECELSTRLADPTDPNDEEQKEAQTRECSAVCCEATSCAGAILRCSILPGDEVACDAFGY